ncbi:MAG: sugar ABC transporter permease [Sphaerochaetaceae bacterium]|jgi:ABC-type sugar transport system permease subunit|nr:sugar ABC transporter permease [Sphaerochaetaceae bacterium]MDX9940575.1 sugar ABC transporter permease [Sphaerochaetaceae bacterium]
MDQKRLDLQKSLMVCPSMLIYLTFMALPIALTVYYGFTNWNGVAPSWQFVGLKNYLRAFTDKQFLYSVRFTLVFSIVITLLSNALGLLFAVLVNGKQRSMNFFRSMIFIPLLISPIAAGFVWKALFSYSGIINQFLERWFGLEAIMFLGKPDMAKLILILFTLWQNIGFCMVIYLAGLQTIPPDFFDAAAIDGANPWQRFKSIIFPYLAPSTTSAVLVMFTSAMREYPRPLVLTAGGPVGQTETLAFRIFKVGFDANQLGYGSAMAAWVLLLTSLLSIAISRLLRRREEFLK